MRTNRRNFVLGTGAALASMGLTPLRTLTEEGTQMYGLIGKMTAVSGQRDALIAILLEAVDKMPGCLSYIIAKDPANKNGIWITEVWDSKTSHETSVKLPLVRRAIDRGRPLIAGFVSRIETEPVGGHGLRNVQP